MPEYQIDVAEDAAAEIAALPAIARKRVVEAIDAQLLHQPTVQTRNRKPLRGLIPPWEHLAPTWEIRVGEYRVFYDVDEGAARVHIRAVRHKPPHRTTEDIL
jgi:mRNA-degrading endonuclease RelE of RelBE toxin-antitoxin system